MVHFWGIKRHVEDVAETVASFATLSPMRARFFVHGPESPLALTIRADADHSTTENLRWMRLI